MAEKCHSILMDSRGRAVAQVASVSADFKSGKVIPEHYHPEHQLVFASAGVMTVHTGQNIWVVPPMRAVWIPALTPHRVVMSGMVSMRTLYLLPKLCRSLPRKCFTMNVSPLLRELILHACQFSKLRTASPVQRRIIQVLIDQLKGVHSIPLQLPQPTDSRALRVVRSLSGDPSDSRSLAALCKECGASKRTVERLFIRETKMTFGKWRQQFRLLHSVELLASGEKVTAAALGAGYNSASAFIAMFRRQLGATPKSYLAGV